MRSLGDYLLLLKHFLLLLSKCPEKLYLLLVWRLPLVVGFESAPQMSFDIHIEGLWLQVGVRRVVDSWDGSGRTQMVQIGCQLCEFSPGCGFLPLLLLQLKTPLVVVQLFHHLRVLLVHMIQVILPRIEVMFILSTVEPSIVFLNNDGHAVEELHLVVGLFRLSFPEEELSASVASEDPLDIPASIQDLLVVPLNLKHSPVFLDVYRCQLLLLSVLLCLNEH
mmetsp:Transcript_4520/g.4235  ORF Transcript_4520/g.4235 Transcript_4520/m.4235 type:complete len:222 (-) Transcript_4520:101-766(-)